MKARLNSLLLSVLIPTFWLSITVQAETTWSENFEGGWGSWTADFGVWEVGPPTSGPGAAHGGSALLATNLSGGSGDFKRTRAAGPAFTVPEAGHNPRLRLWHWFQFSSYSFGEVQVRPDGGEWKAVSTKYYGNSNGAWTRASYDLADYAGQTVQIGFYLSTESGYGNPGWYVDDIEVQTGPLPTMPALEDFESDDAIAYDSWTSDFGVWEVGTPTSGPGAAHGGSALLATNLSGGSGDFKRTRAAGPAFTVPEAGHNPRLRLWHWFQFSSYSFGEVQVRPDGGEWKAVSTKYYGNSNGAWTRASYDLADYAGQTVQIGFYLSTESGYGNPGWYVDDIQVLPNPIPLLEPTFAVFKFSGSKGSLLDGVQVNWLDSYADRFTTTTYEIWRSVGNDLASAVRIADELTELTYKDTTAEVAID